MDIVKTPLGTVIEKYGFKEDLSPSSTVILGGPGLAKALGGMTAAYNPSQRRAPKGSRTGGQWVKQGEAQAAVAAVPQFKNRQEAEQWFRDFGIPDVNLTGMETIPDGLKILQGAAEALAKEASLYPDILGEHGIVALTTIGDARVMAATLAHGDDMSGAWAVTMPADDLVDPYMPPRSGALPFASAVVFADVRDDLAIYRMAEQGMAPQNYEQAFAHELGHVHENAIGWKNSMENYMQAVANVEERMADDAGVIDFRTDVMGSGYMTDAMVDTLSYGVSPYSQASPREGYAEHFVRRTYPDSYERARSRDPESVVWADQIAEEYNRLMGENHL